MQSGRRRLCKKAVELVEGGIRRIRVVVLLENCCWIAEPVPESCWTMGC